MRTAICTLFEGNYHFGLAGLVNSLISYDFIGDIYVGYRGSMPFWINKFEKNLEFYQLNKNVRITFLKLKTEDHLTNYKPQFMMKLIKDHKLEYLFYFDPDIVICENWETYNNWVRNHICLCEDVNSPLLRNHPKRLVWKELYDSIFNLNFNTDVYINGGFIGLHRSYIGFLENWNLAQNEMAKHIGGLNVSKLSGQGKKISAEKNGPFAPFGSTDQDALNVAVASYDDHDKISIIGKDGMGLINGRTIMYHAIGGIKPWNKNFITCSLKGIPPKSADLKFWENINLTIRPFFHYFVRYKLFLIYLTKFLARFYKK